MKRRTWIIRVGDHWFLRNIRDLYETLASKYTTRGQPRGIQSIFKARLPSPFWFRDEVPFSTNLPNSTDSYVSYLKDNESRRSFNRPLDANTELKLFIAGHCDSGFDSLHSLETTTELDFQISARDMAKHLHALFNQVEANPTADKPIKISMVACFSGQGRSAYNGSWHEPFAVQLLEQLHSLGCKHVLIKAPTGSISAPIFGIRSVEGRKMHFYLGDGVIYSTEQANDLRKMALKVLKLCHTNTRVSAKREFLEDRMKAISNLGYTTSANQVAQLKTIIREASQSEQVKKYRDGTGAFMRFFNIRSQTETALRELDTTLETRTETYTEYKTC
jgi:hypothetical protein